MRLAKKEKTALIIAISIFILINLFAYSRYIIENSNVFYSGLVFLILIFCGFLQRNYELSERVQWFLSLLVVVLVVVFTYFIVGVAGSSR